MFRSLTGFNRSAERAPSPGKKGRKLLYARRCVWDDEEPHSCTLNELSGRKAKGFGGQGRKAQLRYRGPGRKAHREKETGMQHGGIRAKSKRKQKRVSKG